MTHLPRLLLPGLLVMVAACDDGAAPPRPPRPAQTAAAAPAQKLLTSKPAAPAAPKWTYSSAGKRDPFKSFLADLDASAGAVKTRCPPPLGKYEVDQLKLVAVVTGLDDPIAMVEGPNGVGYRLHRNDCVGRNGGTVSAVRTGEVVISEWAVKADGTPEKTQTILKLPKEASLNIEE